MGNGVMHQLRMWIERGLLLEDVQRTAGAFL
jgi:hypothetical protein